MTIYYTVIQQFVDVMNFRVLFAPDTDSIYFLDAATLVPATPPKPTAASGTWRTVRQGDQKKRVFASPTGKTIKGRAGFASYLRAQVPKKRKT